MKRLFVLAGLGLIISSNLQAADVELDKIVVSASRTAEDISEVSRNVDVVTKEDIQDTQAQDLGGALTGLTSVNIADYGGLGASKTIRMRGSIASQVLVMQDGRPINNPRDGAVDLSTIPLDDIERVEVVHGAGSDLYGSGAMGGVVNIITKAPPQEKQTTEVYSSFGSFRTYTERFSHGGRLSKFGYLVNGGYQSSEGFRTNSELDTKDINAKFEFKPNDFNALSLNSNFYRSRTGAPGPTYAFDRDNTQKSIKNSQDFNWGFNPDESSGLLLKVYHNYDRLQYFYNSIDSTDEIANGFIDGTVDTHTTKVTGYDLQLNKKFLENYQALCGFNYVSNTNDSTTSGKHKYTVRAAYLENKLDLFDKLKLNFGARMDDYSTFGTKINPSFGALYALKENMRLRCSISKSFRSPTFNDLYWPDQGWSKGNLDLKPEKGITRELGAQTEINKHLSFGLTYYRSDYRDLINWAPDASGLVWQPTNVNSAVIDGIEFKNEIKFNDNWSLDTGYTYLRAKDADSHKYLVYQPKYKADLSLKYGVLNDFTFQLKGQFSDKRFHNSGNTMTAKQFFVLGFNVSKKFKPGVTCFASIDNLLAKKYQVVYGYPMPGFSFTGGAKYEF